MKNRCNVIGLIWFLQYLGLGILEIFYCVKAQLFFNQLLRDDSVAVFLNQCYNINARL